MSIPPKSQIVNVNSNNNFVDTGFIQPNSVTSYSLAPTPISNPPILLGVDFVTQTINGLQVITFPNLPIRGTGNPLTQTQNQPQTITVQPGQLLMFDVSLFSEQGVTSVICQSVDTNKITYPGPFLGPGTYEQFQVVVTTSGSMSITVSGKIYIQR